MRIYEVTEETKIISLYEGAHKRPWLKTGGTWRTKRWWLVRLAAALTLTPQFGAPAVYQINRLRVRIIDG